MNTSIANIIMIAPKIGHLLMLDYYNLTEPNDRFDTDSSQIILAILRYYCRIIPEDSDLKVHEALASNFYPVNRTKNYFTDDILRLMATTIFLAKLADASLDDPRQYVPTKTNTRGKAHDNPAKTLNRVKAKLDELMNVLSLMAKLENMTLVKHMKQLSE